MIHPPRVGEHIKWMKFGKKAFDCQYSYYEVVHVQWECETVLYRPGNEGEGYLRVFVRQAKDSPGEQFDRAQRTERGAQQKRRVEKPGSST